MADEPLAIIEFEQTPAERMDAVELLLEAPIYVSMMRTLRRQRFWSYLFGVATIGLACLGMLSLMGLLTGEPSSETNLWVMLCLGLAIGIALLIVNTSRSQVRGLVLQAQIVGQRSQNGPGSDGPVRIELHEDSVVWAGETTVTRSAWPAFEEVMMSDRLGLGVTFAQRMYIVPARAFEDHDAFVRFMSMMRERGEQAGGTPAAITRHLQTRPFACRGCKYELRGVSEAICPECGREISLRDFRS